jgi:RecJ-like exonuclease
MAKCLSCDGDGYIDCPKCEGRGTITKGNDIIYMVTFGALEDQEHDVDCPRCSGSGRKECGACDGSGERSGD